MKLRESRSKWCDRRNVFFLSQSIGIMEQFEHTTGSQAGIGNDWQRLPDEWMVHHRNWYASPMVQHFTYQMRKNKSIGSCYWIIYCYFVKLYFEWMVNVDVSALYLSFGAREQSYTDCLKMLAYLLNLHSLSIVWTICHSFWVHELLCYLLGMEPAILLCAYFCLMFYMKF